MMPLAPFALASGPRFALCDAFRSLTGPLVPSRLPPAMLREARHHGSLGWFPSGAFPVEQVLACLPPPGATPLASPRPLPVSPVSVPSLPSPHPLVLDVCPALPMPEALLERFAARLADPAPFHIARPLSLGPFGPFDQALFDCLTLPADVPGPPPVLTFPGWYDASPFALRPFLHVWCLYGTSDLQVPDISALFTRAVLDVLLRPPPSDSCWIDPVFQPSFLGAVFSWCAAARHAALLAYRDVLSGAHPDWPAHRSSAWEASLRSGFA